MMAVDPASGDGPSRRPPLMDPLIAALLKPAAYDHPVQRVQLIETHISWILFISTTTHSFPYNI